MTETERTPSVGRIVHYRARGSADGVFPPVCRAAVITEVHPQGPIFIGSEVQDPDDLVVGLAVLSPTGMFFHDAPQDEDELAGGTWHWSERV